MCLLVLVSISRGGVNLNEKMLVTVSSRRVKVNEMVLSANPNFTNIIDYFQYICYVDL